MQTEFESSCKGCELFNLPIKAIFWLKEWRNYLIRINNWMLFLQKNLKLKITPVALTI